MNKPPLGATPYYVAIPNRIEDLSQAIIRYKNERGKEQLIDLWASEIILLTEAMQQLRKRDK